MSLEEGVVDVVDALLETVQERQALQQDQLPVSDYMRGYEAGLSVAALMLNVHEAAHPQRETQLPTWLEQHRVEADLSDDEEAVLEAESDRYVRDGPPAQVQEAFSHPRRDDDPVHEQ